MNKIIPFSKEIVFNNEIGEITSIALDDMLSFSDEYTIKGELVVRGCHKYGDIEEDFSYNLPVLISVDDKYDTKSSTISVDDFYYEIINDNILKVKIELLLDDLYYNDNIDNRDDIDLLLSEKDTLDTEKVKTNLDNSLLINKDNNVTDLFQENNNDKEYSIYRVYTIIEGDTLDSILEKYKVSKDELELYNDLTKLEKGTKLIIPSTDE